LIITGPPRSGKTTLIKKMCQRKSFRKNSGGFFTEEFRDSGKRSGFNIVTVPEGRIGLLAKKGFSSPYRVGRYGVNIKALEKLGCEAMLRSLSEGNIIVVDEIGKMELYSIKFKDALLKGLDSPCKVLATIMERPNVFADKIKNRPDVQLIYLKRETADKVFCVVKKWARHPSPPTSNRSSKKITR
jgi:nucleoside-triphosphatase